MISSKLMAQICFIGLCFAHICIIEVSAAMGSAYNYVLPGSKPPDSFDPLDADNTRNLAAMRLRYLTPIEINQNDELVSTVLEKFNYYPKDRIMEWQVRSGLTFSDGSPLTAEDVVLAVTRMAHAHPNFPVLRHISGLSIWLQREHPLRSKPEGITVSGSKIRIRFDEPLANPLFRFSLEVFSIIPNKCIDQDSGKLTCEIPEASGYYDFGDSGIGKRKIKFVRRVDQIHGEKVPKEIHATFPEGSDYAAMMAKLDKKSVLVANDLKLSSAEVERLQEIAEVKLLPQSRFLYLALRPEHPLFSKQETRLAFADKFREIYAEQTGKKQAHGMFTKLLPGYVSDNELKKLATPLGSKEIELFKKAPPLRWKYYYPAGKGIFDSVFEETARALGIRLEIVPDTSPHHVLFTDGKIDAVGGGLGFWPLDPTGDLEMMFTPGFHPALKWVSENAEIRRALESLRGESTDLADAMKEVNRRLYASGLMNIISHYGRFFLSVKQNSLSSAPIANKSSYPWQLFDCDD